MTKDGGRKEKLSIYLAKKATLHDHELINVEDSQTAIPLTVTNSESALLYIRRDGVARTPSWTKLFTDSTEVSAESFGKSSSVGAVLIVRAGTNIFLLSFGTGFHLIKNEAFERDFGLRVTLNSVDPDKVRSLDKATYDHNPLNSRTQSTRDVDIFELHVDSELEMLYAVTGMSEVDVFGSYVTGRDSLTIMVEVKLKNLADILFEASRRFHKSLPQKFSWVDNVSKVRDSEVIEILDLELNDNFMKGTTSSFWLGEPEIVDWETQIGYSFDLYARTQRHVVLNLSDYLQYLAGKNEAVSAEGMKSDSIHVNNINYESTRHWSVYRCLYAEISVGGELYILRNGIWYKVNTNFVDSIDKHLEKLVKCTYDFPIYNHDREEEYNDFVTKNVSNFALMDKRNIKIGGPYDKLEFCDLIMGSSDFIHVKYYRSSGTLSHLFSQGAVAAEAFVKDESFRKNLNVKLPSAIRLKNAEQRPNPSDYKVIYAIATDKNLPTELPFFSKVTLKNALLTLKGLNFNVELATIKIDPELKKRKKCKPNKL